MTHPTVTPLRTAWLPTNEAAHRLGISRRTIQRRARAGSIETRPGALGCVEYRVPAHDDTRADTTAKTPPVTRHDTGIAAFERLVDKLRAEINESHQARRNAELRIAVAEYQLKNVTADLETMTAERDLARAQGQRLADAMRKRHGLIKRLTARLGAAS